MALPGGVQITGFLSPTASGDTYATHDALYGRDGLRNIDLLSDLNNIPADRRRAGMIVGVSGNTGSPTYWSLLPEGTGWTYTLSDWTQAFLSPSATTALVASAISSDTYVTGFTVNENTYTIFDNSGNTFSTTWSGNTYGSCINNFWVSKIHSCSPLFINPNNEGNIYVGGSSGLTIVTNTGSTMLGINTGGVPNYPLHVIGDAFIANGYVAIGGTSPDSSHKFRITTSDSDGNNMTGARVDLSQIASTGNFSGLQIRSTTTKTGSNSTINGINSNLTGSAVAGTHTSVAGRFRAATISSGGIVNNYALQLEDGSEGTIGHVWTQVTTDGRGHWGAVGASGISSDTFVSGATFDGISTIYFHRNDTLSAFTVDLSTLDVNDTFISGMTFNNSTYDLTIHRNDGVDFTQSLWILSSDMVVTGGTYDINTGIVTFKNNSGGTFQVSGFTSGMTDSYTVTAYTVGNKIVFDNNIQGNNLYNVDLTPILSGYTTGFTSPYKINTGTTNGIQPIYGNNVTIIDYSNIGGGSGNTISNGSLVSSANTINSIVGGNNNNIYESNISIIGGGKNNVISGSSYGFIGGGHYNTIGNVKSSGPVTFNYATGRSIIGGGYKNEIRSNTFWFGNSILGGEENKIEAPLMDPTGSPYASYVGLSTIGGGKGNTIYAYNAVIAGGYRNKIFRSGWYGGNINGGKRNELGVSSLSFGYTAGNCVIGGGSENKIGDITYIYGRDLSFFNQTAYYGTIGGGAFNSIDRYSTEFSTIGGGSRNRILGSKNGPTELGPRSSIGKNTRYNTIGGGSINQITSGQTFSTIGGGQRNWIGYKGYVGDTTIEFTSSQRGMNIICGGANNIIWDGELLSGGTNNGFVEKSIIGGGYGNRIGTNVNQTERQSIGSVIGGGERNWIVNGNFSFIGGGYRNEITDIARANNYVYLTAESNVIVGGHQNKIILRVADGITLPSGDSDSANIIGGGKFNKIYASGSSFNMIGGGENNIISGTSHSVIVSGKDSKIYGGLRNFIGGGVNNIISGQTSYNTIGGGTTNKIISNSSYNFIGGGVRNYNHGYGSIIVGGDNNIIGFGDSKSFIGGGNGNYIKGFASSVINGSNNQTRGYYTAIINGYGNYINSGVSNSAIIGCSYLTVTASNMTYICNLTVNGSTYISGTLYVGGSQITQSPFKNSGLSNQSIIPVIGNNSVSINTNHSTIGGGSGNTVNAKWSFLGGGLRNTVNGYYYNSMIGGRDNIIDSGSYNTIGGGSNNSIIPDGNISNTIGGGYYNRIKKVEGAFIGGGYNNLINNYNNISTIIGGSGNTINHSNSHIIGSNITSISANTTHVERLNINTTNSGSTSDDVLVKESNGIVNTRSVTSITGGLKGKYAIDFDFTGGTTSTITHNLDTTDVLVQIKDASGKLIIPDTVNNYTNNSVDIKVSSTETMRVIIIG